jgi:uncharacterized protein YciU (UPF0263 family)
MEPQMIDLDMDLDIISGNLSQADLISSINQSFSPRTGQEIADDLEEETESQATPQEEVNTQQPNEIKNKLQEELEALEKIEKPKEKFNEDAEAEINEASDEETLNDEPLTVTQILKELNVFDIPKEYESKENLTDEDLYFLAEHTKNKQKESILEEIASNIKDDYERELFEYWKTPTSNKNLPRYQEMLDDIKYFSTLDTNDENNQKELLTFFLKDGLDPKNPAHAFRLNNIEKDVNNILQSGSAQEQTEAAKRHVQMKINTRRLEEKRRVDQEAQMIKQQQQQQIEESRRWFDNVNNIINNANWDKQIKDEITKEIYTEIQVGEQVKPVWLAKLDAINSEPNLHIEFIRFLNSFDLKTNQFKTKYSEKEVKKAAVSKINRLADRKVKIASTKSPNTRNNQQTTRRIQIDPFL